MKLLALIFLCTTAIIFAEDVNLSKPIPELALQNGRIYKNVFFVSYAVNVVSAKWDGGAGTIAYNLLPDDVRKVAESKRPKAEPKRKAAPESIAKKEMKPRGPYYLEGRVLSKANGVIFIRGEDTFYNQNYDRSKPPVMTDIVALKEYKNYAEVGVRDWLKLIVMRTGDHDSNDFGQVPLVQVK